MIRDVERDYKTDVRDLLQGFFLGKWVDRFTKAGNMTAFMYQGVRMKAWRDGQNYRRFPKPVVDLEVRAAWGAVEVLLAHLDAVDVLQVTALSSACSAFSSTRALKAKFTFIFRSFFGIRPFETLTWSDRYGNGHA